MAQPGAAVLGVGGHGGLGSLGPRSEVWLVGHGGSIRCAAYVYLPPISVSKPKGEATALQVGLSLLGSLPFPKS